MSLHAVRRDEIQPSHPVGVFDLYFGARRQETGIVMGANVDLLDMPEILPWLLIVEDVGTEQKVSQKFRFTGTSVCGLLGYDPTNLHLDRGLPPEVRDMFGQECLRAQVMQAPLFSQADFKLAGRSKKTVFLMFQPVSSFNDGLVDQIFWVIAPVTEELNVRSGCLLQVMDDTTQPEINTHEKAGHEALL